MTRLQSSGAMMLPIVIRTVKNRISSTVNMIDSSSEK
jgi:hypothetical protein